MLPAVVAPEGWHRAGRAGWLSGVAGDAGRGGHRGDCPGRLVYPPRGAPGRGAVALLPGIAATAAGAGIASAHLAKAGPDAAAVLAAVVLVTSIVLLVCGAAAPVRATPGWWRLLAIPAALALLQFVLMPLTYAVHATNRLPGTLGTGTPPRSTGSPTRTWPSASPTGAAISLVYPGGFVEEVHFRGFMLQPLRPRGHGGR